LRTQVWKKSNKKEPRGPNRERGGQGRGILRVTSSPQNGPAEIQIRQLIAKARKKTKIGEEQR